MKKLRKIVEDGEPKILMFSEKYGTWYYIINSEEELHRVCVSVLKQRLDEGYWYGSEDDAYNNKTGFQSIEEIETLPDGSVKKNALQEFKTYANWSDHYANQKILRKEIKEVIEYTFNPKDKRFVRNKAFDILMSRRNCQYEQIDLITPSKIP